MLKFFLFLCFTTRAGAALTFFVSLEEAAESGPRLVIAEGGKAHLLEGAVGNFYFLSY